MAREDTIQWEQELGDKFCYICDKNKGGYSGKHRHVRLFTESHRNTANPSTDWEDACMSCAERVIRGEPLVKEKKKRSIFDDLFS